MEGTEEDTTLVNPRLQTVAEGPSREDAPLEEVLLSVMLVEEESGAGVPESLLEVEPQTVPSPRRANVSSTGLTIEQMA
jgi:hypothetical protein